MRLTKRGVSLTICLLLALAGAATALTGWLQVRLELHRFLPHRYLAYSAIALGCLHVALHSRELKAQFQRMLRPRGERAPAQPKKDSRPEDRFLGVHRREILVGGVSTLLGFALGFLSRSPAKSGQAPQGDLGELYHQWSKPSYRGLLRAAIFWGERPPQYKTYPQARRVQLPRERPPGRLTLEEAIQRRRSRRSYTGAAITLDELSHLLHHAAGVTGGASGLRAAPSAGALYPMELYIAANQVAGLEGGIYHYQVGEHALEEVAKGDRRQAFTAAALGQDMVGKASANFILSAIFQRTRWRYQERSYRYILLEAGHMAQNLYLAAEALGLGACAVGAFLDDDLNQLLGLDGTVEAVVYLVSVGKL